jgi:hypothetical protein
VRRRIAEFSARCANFRNFRKRYANQGSAATK